MFDRNIPTLTQLDGDRWASELLTLYTRSMRSTMTFDFNHGRAYYVARIEVVLFNCPQWGISIREILLIDSITRWTLGCYYPSSTSCNSLVRVCLPYINSRRRKLTLQFVPDRGSSWLHLAEVEFHCIGNYCPRPRITTVTTPTLPTTPPTVPTTAPTLPTTHHRTVPTTTPTLPGMCHS